MKHIEIQYLSPIEVQIDFCTAETVDRRIFLLGTAHVSEQSAQQTEDKIAELQPDCICVELDRQRYKNLQQQERWQNLDLFKTLKEGKGFLLLVNLLLASFQKRVGRNLAMKPGQEMIRAIELAQQQQIQLELVDRPVEVTLKRAWAACNSWQRAKLLNGLIVSLFSNEQISEQDIENLKQANTLEHLMDEFANYLPSIKASIIDERDVFLARSIAAAPGQNVFAVLGAGHLRGVCQVLERVLAETASTDKADKVTVTIHDYTVEPLTESLESLDIPKDPQTESTGAKPANDMTQAGQATAKAVKPPNPAKNLPEWLQDPSHTVPSSQQLLTMPRKSTLAKFLPWIVPLLAVAIMVAGFFFADTQKALQGLGIWALAHSALAGLAALLVLAHPLSILVAILSSPFTALNPTISVGMVTALTEVLLRKPQVKDLENLLELEKWWQFRQNRIWHALIIFMVVSLGGAAATFIALPWLSVLFAT